MSEDPTEKNIDDIILHQRKQINKEKARMEEAQLLREAINGHDTATEFRIINVAEGFYELTIDAEELTSEVQDTLDMSIVSDATIENEGDGVRISATLDYQPLNVSSTARSDR